ncbi:hypothetical protein BC792_10858 [Sphingobacterium allocomposti]|jgi:hypothetical protein|uniref:Phosphatidate cytidylyltransferase n=1 Tax=Sphingobacterium allocomposti TaxID=415956 RepID=A0A5S5DLN5_9SPHI|nr:hypothetical protein [Sphingobacterium composti Yoo et al. 2007 non Ten et al. 2007]TYP95966.1 hypothetical protein BC792_10858 [Sphingobacterium composti Yoo et al. 2007 non Ten et al. 2007]HLS95327.1 hypothetical protein [Sphingobacterium sp.]
MKRFSHVMLFVFAVMTLTSCEVIGGIFKAGVWSGVILVVLVIALIIWIIARMAGGRRR